MSENAESLFEQGATYTVRKNADCLRDRFVSGETLVYWRHAYSIYDGMHGWFFYDAAGAIRSWDSQNVDVLARDALFVFQAPPPPLLDACAEGSAVRVKEALAKETPSRGLRRIAFDRLCRSRSAVCFAALLDVSGIDDAEKVVFLHAAAGEGFDEGVRLLLDSGMTPDAMDVCGQTPLMIAAASGAVETVVLLLARGADPSIKNQSERTAADLAKAFKHFAVVEHLERFK